MSCAKLLSALALAATFHQDQRRKGSGGAPYINHLIEVANILATIANVHDIDLLIAAVFHDILEDTSAKVSDIKQIFGARVTTFVEAVTDDKSLPKEERKRLQIEHMRVATVEIKLIKLADHCSNITSLPNDWPSERKNQFLDWSEQVAFHCFGINLPLDKEYQKRLHVARQSLLIK